MKRKLKHSYKDFVLDMKERMHPPKMPPKAYQLLKSEHHLFKVVMNGAKILNTAINFLVYFIFFCHYLLLSIFARNHQR